MTASAPSEAARAWRGLVAPGLATLVGLAILIALGMWQLERRAWKEDLVARLATRSQAEPGPLLPEAQWPDWRADADEFRRVRLTGAFLHEREILVHGLRPGAPGAPGSAILGYYVFTPLRQADGAIVFVNRGFVPTELKNPATRARGQVEAPVTVTGIVRAPEVRTLFVPAGDPARGEWFVRNTSAMAASLGLARAAPFYVEADATPNPGGWPQGGRSAVDLPNNHLQYALTWFGLALTLAGVFAAFAFQRLRGPDPAQTASPARAILR